MINDFFIGFLDFLNSLYVSLGVSGIVENLIDVFSKINDYSITIQTYLSGAYYVFGKNLVDFTFKASGFVFLFRLVMALIYIVGNYVP